MPADSSPLLYINGKRYTLPGDLGACTLLQYLRDVGLTGTKLGCGEGGCGACTVMVSSYDSGALVHRSVNACLCPVYAVEGMHVVTVEGIGNSRDGLHPVQERLAKAHGSQCGFCTPGFVMSMYSLLRSKPEPPTEEEIEDNLAGNLCRCTGYRPILDAFKVFAKLAPAAYTEEAIVASKASAGEATAHNSSTQDGSAEHLATENGAAQNGHEHTEACSNGSCVANGVVTSKGAAALEKKHPPSSGNGKVCPSTGQPCDCGAAEPGEVRTTSKDKELTAGPATFTRPTAEPIFPAELKKRSPQELNLPGPTAAWHRPISLDSLLALKAQYPEAKLVVGNTEVGIEMKFKDARYPVLIGATHVPELNAMEVSDAGLTVGASVTLSRLLASCLDLVAERPAHTTSTFAALAEQLRWFAGNQIRNTASVGGNVVTGSPISDMNPIYMAAGATFTVVGEGTPEREVPAEDFFLGYRKVDLKPHEILLKVFIPFTDKYEYVKEFKQAHRRDDDIAIVNAGMRMKLRQTPTGSWEIEAAKIAYGGVAPKTIMAPLAQKALVGELLEQFTLDRAIRAVGQDVRINKDAPGGMVEFRQSLAASFLFRFFMHVAIKLESDAAGYQAAIPPEFRSAVAKFERPASHGLQYYSQVPDQDIVGQPVRHLAADLQVTGEAQYCDDIRLPAHKLEAALVLSTHAHANILSVDASEALQAPGVVAFYSGADIPGDNWIGAVIHDEECFCTKTVTAVGDRIGVVVADTEAHARAAAKLVRVEYEDLPAIFDCEQAIAANSFYEGHGGTVECGDVDAAFAECDHIIEGVSKMGGQEHFYLEPQVSLIIPGESDELHMWSSTQCPQKHQSMIAGLLAIPQHKIVCHTKRIGGGFGGKESRSAAINATIALPAWHLRRPVRIVLDRDEDMHITGHRHPFLGKYKVGFTKEGKIVALDTVMYCNAGNNLDLSGAVMQRALLHCQNCYNIPNLRAVGHVCKTNISSNTAFRGFGGPQGMMVAEMWMDQMARVLGKPAEALRELNFTRTGDVMSYKQKLVSCQVESCWQNVMQRSDFGARQAAVAEFNAANRWRKRGLAVVPTMFGISFTAKFLNQAGALVHIYTDGTVLVTHGGVEMGQGLHTKVAQVAAAALNVPLSSVYIAETATDKVPNASPTAASASSDLYGAAVANACQQLNERLAPFKAAKPDAGFMEIVNAAYMERVDLSAHGFFKTPDITGWGGVTPFNYFTHGVACSEVELDCLAGDFQLLRTDICMDLGKSLNPAIDVGQVEGGFVQGLGWTCIEELVWGDKEHSWVRPGTLHTRGPGTYKIPTANDIPIDMRVSLLANSTNERLQMVHSSKAVGEPPFFLGASVFFALKEAVYAARKDAGHEGWFAMDSPATPERLRMACADHLTATYAAPDLMPKISC
ncbi:hypothetical protein WJX72_002855 [[Myrmecia] bisecta]|uniref:xanthine dehydrogenase n=1 Tax=[Myrmecia] bisecta TaxID=41462 RepID=A0AAW1PRX4_9CHLO